MAASLLGIHTGFDVTAWTGLAGIAGAVAAFIVANAKGANRWLWAGVAAIVVFVISAAFVSPTVSGSDDQKKSQTPDYGARLVKICDSVRAARLPSATPEESSTTKDLPRMVSAHQDYQVAQNALAALTPPEEMTELHTDTLNNWKREVKLFNDFAEKAKVASQADVKRDFAAYDRETDKRLQREVATGLRSLGGDECRPTL
jgi:hypothetical protein